MDGAVALAQIRASAGLTQVELAKRLGMKQASDHHEPSPGWSREGSGAAPESRELAGEEGFEPSIP
jgi:transcriptional regulator with XRE-family HTH domain